MKELWCNKEGRNRVKEFKMKEARKSDDAEKKRKDKREE